MSRNHFAWFLAATVLDVGIPSFRSAIASSLLRLGLGSGSFLAGGLFALQISDAAFAFFDFVVLLSHNSLLCVRDCVL